MADTDWRTKLRDAQVVEIKRKKSKDDAGEDQGKRGPKFSPGVMSWLGAAERRLATGLADGAAEYARRSKKAATKGTDGAVLSAARNLLNAQEKVVKQAAKLPGDLTKGREFRRASKGAKRITRLLTW